MKKSPLLYVQEHTSCFNYVSNKRKSLVSVFYEKGILKKEDSQDEAVIIFISEGKILVSYNEYHHQEVKGEEFFMIPPNTTFTLETCEDTKLIIAYIHSFTHLCKCFSLDKLTPFVEKIEPGFHKLPYNYCLKGFLCNLETYLNDGLRCFNFLKLKHEEFFFILRAYYSKEEAAAFFYPVIGRDMDFREFVLANYLKINTVKEFAELANYSISGFEKKFVREFGKPIHRWIMNEKSKKILQDIYYSDDSLKNICMNYNFSSPAHFSQFCKKTYGRSPSEIRKEHRAG